MASGGGGRFPTTHWSLVARAGRLGDAGLVARALSQLCEAYWYPIYVHIRARGFDSDAARDLTQSFFLKILERDGYFAGLDKEHGRFRSFLRACVNHFLANERDAAAALKRGGAIAFRPLEFDSAEERYRRVPAATGATPDQLFERQWAFALLGRTLARLERDSAHPHFELLKPFLTGEAERGAYEAAAAAMGTTEGALKVAVHRLRKEYREALRAEIAETVAEPTDIEAEIRYLLGVLS